MYPRRPPAKGWARLAAKRGADGQAEGEAVAVTPVFYAAGVSLVTLAFSLSAALFALFLVLLVSEQAYDYNGTGPAA